jgi:hypothetical protein
MPPLEFYTWDTPNGKKISILLEELGIEYTFKPMCERSARVSNVRPTVTLKAFKAFLKSF